VVVLYYIPLLQQLCQLFTRIDPKFFSVKCQYLQNG